MKRVLKPGALALALVFSCAFNAKAVSSASLPNVSLLAPYAEFGNQLVENLATVNGNVGVSNGGTLTVTAPSVINGNVNLGLGATLSRQGKITGTITTGLNLTATQNQVFSASSTLSGFSANQTFSTLNSAESFTAPAGTALVVDVGNLGLNNQNINFSGAGDLVLNVSGSFSLVGSASILSSDPSHVFINYTGSSEVQTHVGDIIDGSLFIPKAGATLDGTFFGALYGGDHTITLMSGATLTQVAPVPEGSTGVLLAVVGLFTGGTLVRRTRRGVKQALGSPRAA